MSMGSIETVSASASEFSPVTHVIFDMDGLLLDTETLYTKAISKICESHGCKFTMEAKTAAMGKTKHQAAEAIIKYSGLDLTPEEYIDIAAVEYKLAFESVDWLPGAYDLIHHLAKNSIPIALATSSNSDAYLLKTRGKEDTFALFDHILTAGDDPEVKHGKPAPDTFIIAAQRFKNPPKDSKSVLVFEDSQNGVKSGLAAGMQVVWVPDRSYTDPSTEPATQVIDSLRHFDPKLFGLPPFVKVA